MREVVHTNIFVGDWLKVTRPDKTIVYVRVTDRHLNGGYETREFTINAVDAHNAIHMLDWGNCYSFGNGVESNRVTDGFNNPYVTPGVKVSTVFEDYKEEHRKYGLIYSGIYNSIGSVNNLNQFIQAEKITKDINPTYGSIQKLHTRDSDLIALCEDKVLKIQANKDALYNADGNINVTATHNVLGQAIPFVGEYGISKNPESFVSEAYRSYFTDKQRGVVMRLSKDGLTPISMHGMTDWFRDNLKTNHRLVGSYDARNDEYNITLTANPPFGSIVTNSKAGMLPSVDQYNNPIIIRVVSIEERHYQGKMQTILELDHSVDDLHLDYYSSTQEGNNGTLTFYKPDGVTEIATAKLGFLYNPTDVQGVGVSYFVIITELSSSATVSFREDVRGWVSFKSFVPENAISCANDYFTMLDGKIYKHYDESVNRNTFYDTYTDSSVNVILNSQPSSVKSFHTLDYEGSESRVEGIRTVDVTGIEHAGGAEHDGRYFFYEKEDMSGVINEDDFTQWHSTVVEMKQYRGKDNLPILPDFSNAILVREGSMRLFNDPLESSGVASPSGGLTKGHGRLEPYDASNPGDFMIGDIITTERQEKVVSYSNSFPKDGWYASNIKTDKQKGNLPEFIEKEGKWFNYIKGIDSDISKLGVGGVNQTDFGAFDIQGIGIVENIKERNIVDVNRATMIPGFTILFNDIVAWAPETYGAVGVHKLENVMRSQDIVDGTNYRLTLEVSNYTGTGEVGIVSNAGVSGNARFDENSVDNIGYGTYTEDFTSNGNPLDMFGTDTNTATIKLSIAELPTLDGELVFANDINSSLQIGDTLYFNQYGSEILGENLLPELIAENWDYSSGVTVTFDDDGVLAATVVPTGGSGLYPSIWSNAINLVDGKEYQLDITISDYNNAGANVVKNYIRGMEQATWQVPNPPNASSPEYRPITNSNPEVIVGQATYSFVFDRHDVSVGNSGSRTVRFQLELTGGNTDSKSVRLKNVSLREFGPGSVFGGQKEGLNLVKCGTVTRLIKSANILENQQRVFNVVTVDTRGGTLPSINDYIFFSKNQAINTSSLLGYYADVKLKNNSKNKVEMFSVNSEITESSK